MSHQWRQNGRETGLEASEKRHKSPRPSVSAYPSPESVAERHGARHHALNVSSVRLAGALGRSGALRGERRGGGFGGFQRESGPLAPQTHTRPQRAPKSPDFARLRRNGPGLCGFRVWADSGGWFPALAVLAQSLQFLPLVRLDHSETAYWTRILEPGTRRAKSAGSGRF